MMSKSRLVCLLKVRKMTEEKNQTGQTGAKKVWKKYFGFKKLGIEIEFGAPEEDEELDKSREIHKKISREYFELIKSGQKTFEYRVNDFDCRPGDILVLEEWEYEGSDSDKTARRPTGRILRKKVGYVGYTSEFDWLNRPDVKADLEEYGTQIISLLDEWGYFTPVGVILSVFDIDFLSRVCYNRGIMLVFA